MELGKYVKYVYKNFFAYKELNEYFCIFVIGNSCALIILSVIAIASQPIRPVPNEVQATVFAILGVSAISLILGITKHMSTKIKWLYDCLNDEEGLGRNCFFFTCVLYCS
eukprot:TRINITY_DN2905_c0_g1_i7.p2 TRINITY_DN2905_c0_g1~~TRINITY_DN2905_c0_g1_i7.p2  ORF type:complete len:110 (+),score=8.17 TRINITY_DN2905_c0_g1_i7:110-439(+)